MRWTGRAGGLGGEGFVSRKEGRGGEHPESERLGGRREGKVVLKVRAEGETRFSLSSKLSGVVLRKTKSSAWFVLVMEPNGVQTTGGKVKRAERCISKREGKRAASVPISPGRRQVLVWLKKRELSMRAEVPEAVQTTVKRTAN